MLPPIPIPIELSPFIANVTGSPVDNGACRTRPPHEQVLSMVKEHLPEELQRCAFLNREFERRGEELFEVSKDYV
jgi:hypothetical protein